MSKENVQRMGVAGVGALAGFSLWLLIEVLPDALDNQWLILWLGSTICGFFVLLLGLIGPLKPREAVSVSGVLGLSAAALLYWASLRFTQIDDVFEFGFDPAAFAALIFIGAPFGAAVMRGRVWDYAYLFDTAWGIVVRYLAAWVFVGLFWGALFLSHALLEIVGISVIGDVIDIDVMPYLLTGLVLGLALEVANELRAYVSPYLLLRLLRLLMPPLVLVVAVFILALPFRGLSGLFGEFSAAGTLMAVAIAGASLIAAAVDSSDEEAAQSGLMRLATKAFAAMLPILGALAVWAVVIRIADYGWTPVRLAAFIAALFVLGYGVLYGLALMRADWMARIRRANIYHALAVLLVAALWLSPVLDASRISANTQVARYLKGGALKDLPAWEIANEWGRAGDRALERLRGLNEDTHPGLSDLLVRAESDSKWEFDQADQGPTRLDHAKLALEAAKIFPDAGALTAEDLSAINRYVLESLAKDCHRDLCVFVTGGFGDGSSAKVMAFVPRALGGADVSLYGKHDTELFFDRHLDEISAEAFERVKAGDFRIAPSSLQSLWIGDMEIAPGSLGDQFELRALE